MRYSTAQELVIKFTKIKGKRLALALFWVFLNFTSNAQEHSAYKEQIQVQHFFSKDISLKSLKDSTTIYTFTFTVNVKKDIKGEINVESITANDSAAFEIFPSYKFLKSLDYKPFMKNRKHAFFIFPVAIQVFGSKRPDLQQLPNLLVYIPKLFASSKTRDMESCIYFDPFLISIDKTVFH